MEINKTKDGDKLKVAVCGCLDTTTSPQLQTEVETGLDGVKSLEFDFSKLDYVSSAGLRVLLMANKKMLSNGGAMTIAGVNPQVREVFEMTGFLDIFTLV